MEFKDAKQKRKLLEKLKREYSVELGFGPVDVEQTKKELRAKYGVELGLVSRSEACMEKRTKVNLFGESFSQGSFSDFWKQTKAFLNVTNVESKDKVKEVERAEEKVA